MTDIQTLDPEGEVYDGVIVDDDDIAFVDNNLPDALYEADTPQLVALVNHKFEEFQRAGTTAVVKAWEMGTILAKIKADGKTDGSIPHGAWEAWLSTNCPEISKRTAQAYMNLSENAQTSAELGESIDRTLKAIRAAKGTGGGGAGGKGGGSKDKGEQPTDPDALPGLALSHAQDVVAQLETLTETLTEWYESDEYAPDKAVTAEITAIRKALGALPKPPAKQK